MEQTISEDCEGVTVVTWVMSEFVIRTLFLELRSPTSQLGSMDT